ncbi:MULTISPECIES: tyrosine-type recombinase/integrase [Frankia]|uniref:Integrase (Site-specific recombinase, phage integrase family) n=1 Tax=Frankia alni (strain DSM 45986 / CECT 9034 / ACN14a) TaxID=326424 RepID=Q0RT15_FRAAA|nr:MULTISPECIES: tyrosine-type recombinase/integrase [Frankia]CAJ59288.1 putative integrase (Site-specific recombinase, phage integrase family) [Frankia alni ACN14a]
MPAAAGATEIVVGMRYREPVGTWTLYVDREPVGEVTVVSAVPMSGTRARLTLAAPLPVDIGVDAELGWSMLSRRRLHDLRHSSASIQLAEGMDLALVSKRMRHSSTSITGNLYVHLLRSSGQEAAEAVAAAVPRSARRGRTRWAPNPRRGSFRLTRARFPLVAEESARSDHCGG